MVEFMRSRAERRTVHRTTMQGLMLQTARICLSFLRDRSYQRQMQLQSLCPQCRRFPRYERIALFCRNPLHGMLMGHNH
jgi:hypothetical protein